MNSWGNILGTVVWILAIWTYRTTIFSKADFEVVQFLAAAPALLRLNVFIVVAVMKLILFGLNEIMKSFGQRFYDILAFHLSSDFLDEIGEFLFNTLK